MESVLKLHEMNSFEIPKNKKSTGSFHKSGSTSRENFEQKLSEMMNTIDMLEFKLNQKADEVVSYQVLTQRKEMNELAYLLTKIEKRLENVEKKLDKTMNEEMEFQPVQLKRKK